MKWLEDLRLQGYSPRTLLDVGAHLGEFTKSFLQTFPNCVPSLIEPNPFCHTPLDSLPFTIYPFAASNKNGAGEIFLTKEWLQTTGASLYRENTEFFRDDVVVKYPIDKRRLDDLFEGQRFDFVKIDTQGSELDVLQGGETVLRKADYILVEVSLVEYNLGGAKAEEIFSQLKKMNFSIADVTEFHRFSAIRNGDIFQMDFLFQKV